MLGVTSGCKARCRQSRFDKAKELVAEKIQQTDRNPYDLEPEELLISRYFKRRIRQ